MPQRIDVLLLVMSQRDAWEAFVRRVEELKASGETHAKIAQLIGEKHRSKITKIIDGTLTGEQTNAAKMIAYLRGVGLNPDDYYALGPSPEDFDYIPLVKARLGAGGSLITDSGVEHTCAFRKDFLRSIGPVRDLVLFKVMGDSMTPTLEEGDTVLVNKGQRDVVSGKLYAVREGNELKVKRLITMPGAMRVKSDNPDHGEYKINLGEGSQEDFKVIGRVRWIGRTV